MERRTCGCIQVRLHGKQHVLHTTTTRPTGQTLPHGHPTGCKLTLPIHAYTSSEADTPKSQTPVRKQKQTTMATYQSHRQSPTYLTHSVVKRYIGLTSKPRSTRDASPTNLPATSDDSPNAKVANTKVASESILLPTPTRGAGLSERQRKTAEQVFRQKIQKRWKRTHESQRI